MAFFRLLQTEPIKIAQGQFACPLCSLVMSCQAHVRRHLLIHTGEKPYGCPYCPSRFNRKGNCDSHIRNVHKSFNLDGWNWKDNSKSINNKHQFYSVNKKCLFCRLHTSSDILNFVLIAEYQNERWKILLPLLYNHERFCNGYKEALSNSYWRETIQLSLLPSQIQSKVQL